MILDAKKELENKAKEIKPTIIFSEKLSSSSSFLYYTEMYLYS